MWLTVCMWLAINLWYCCNKPNQIFPGLTVTHWYIHLLVHSFNTYLYKNYMQNFVKLKSVQFSCSVVSNSLTPHELQHSRPPYPSPTPGACSNSCPLSRWCHSTISSSVIPFSSHLQSFPASGSFQMSQFFASGGERIEASASAAVLPVKGLMLKLKLQYCAHLMWRTDSFEKTLMPGKIEGRRRGGDGGWDAWMASLTQWIWIWASSWRWWRTDKPGVLQFMGSQRVGHDWSDLAAAAAAWFFQ